MGVLAEPRVKGRHLRAKWEAIRRTKETLASQIPTEGSGKSMGLGMARKLMENLGWKDGQGLGASNQGLAEPVKLHQNIDSRGVGYTAKRGMEQEHHAAHFQRFESVLATLSAAHRTQDQSATEEEAKDCSGLDGKPAEPKPKRNRNRLSYHKISRAKDVSQYSRHDLECVIGAKAHALYSDVVKEKQQESLDQLTVSELNTTEFFSSERDTKSDPPHKEDEEENTDTGPSFGTNEEAQIEAQKTDDKIQKNFEERMASSYATCFVSAGSAFASKPNPEEANCDDAGTVDVQSQLKKDKKKKKKAKKDKDDMENSSNALQDGGKLDLSEGGLQNAKESELRVDSAIQVVQQVENKLTATEGHSSVSKTKKKKNRFGKNDSNCKGESKGTSNTNENDLTQIDSSTATAAKPSNTFPTSASSTTCGFNNTPSSTLWSKYSHYYASSFVKGDTLPGSIESSAQESEVLAEETFKKDRKKKSKRKDELVATDARLEVSNSPDENKMSVCGATPESAIEESEEFQSQKNSGKKKKRKNKASEALDSGVDENEFESQRKTEPSKSNTTSCVTGIVGENSLVVKKKKTNKGQELEASGEMRENEQFTLNLGKCTEEGTTLSQDSLVTKNSSCTTLRKKKNKSKKGSDGKKENCDETNQGSCEALDDRESKHAKRSKKHKQSQSPNSNSSSVAPTVGEPDGEATSEQEKKLAEVSQDGTSELPKEKKKKKSIGSEVFVVDELQSAAPAKEGGSKKRKRQETHLSEENELPGTGGVEKRSKKKKRKEHSDH